MFKTLLPWKLKHNKTKVMAAETTMEQEVLIQNQSLLPCQTCGRTFLPIPLKKHEKICLKNSQKKRRPFNSLKQRVEGTDLAAFHINEVLKPTPFVSQQEIKKVNHQSKWKEKHLELVNTIRAARGCNVTMASPKKSSSTIMAGNERCPSCDRQFGPKAFDRHVEWCKEHKARIQKSPAANQLAKERLEARTKYRVPPLNKSKRSLTREKYSSPNFMTDKEPVTPTESMKSFSSVSLSRSPSIRKPNTLAISRKRSEKVKVETSKEKEKLKLDIPSPLNMSSPSPKVAPLRRKPGKKSNFFTPKINSEDVNTQVDITVSSLCLTNTSKKMVTWKDSLPQSVEFKTPVKVNSRKVILPKIEAKKTLVKVDLDANLPKCESKIPIKLIEAYKKSKFKKNKIDVDDLLPVKMPDIVKNDDVVDEKSTKVEENQDAKLYNQLLNMCKGMAVSTTNLTVEDSGKSNESLIRTLNEMEKKKIEAELEISALDQNIVNKSDVDENIITKSDADQSISDWFSIYSNQDIEEVHEISFVSDFIEVINGKNPSSDQITIEIQTEIPTIIDDDKTKTSIDEKNSDIIKLVINSSQTSITNQNSDSDKKETSLSNFSPKSSARFSVENLSAVDEKPKLLNSISDLTLYRYKSPIIPTKKMAQNSLISLFENNEKFDVDSVNSNESLPENDFDGKKLQIKKSKSLPTYLENQLDETTSEISVNHRQNDDEISEEFGTLSIDLIEEEIDYYVPKKRRRLNSTKGEEQEVIKAFFTNFGCENAKLKRKSCRKRRTVGFVDHEIKDTNAMGDCLDKLLTDKISTRSKKSDSAPPGCTVVRCSKARENLSDFSSASTVSPRLIDILSDVFSKNQVENVVLSVQHCKQLIKLDKRKLDRILLEPKKKLLSSRLTKNVNNNDDDLVVNVVKANLSGCYMKYGGLVEERQYDPFESAQRQFMELLEGDNNLMTPYKPTFTTQTSKSPNLKRTSVIDPPCNFQDSMESVTDEFELLENLINDHFKDENTTMSNSFFLHDQKNNNNNNSKLDNDIMSLSAILSTRKYSDDMSSIDPSLINENDNLSIPDHFKVDDLSPTSTIDTDITIRNEEINKETTNKKITKTTTKTEKPVIKRSVSLINRSDSIRKKVKDKATSASTIRSTSKPLTTKSKLTSQSNSSVNFGKGDSLEKKKGLPLLKKSMSLFESSPKPTMKNREDVDNYFSGKEQKLNSFQGNVEKEELLKPEDLFAVDDKMFEEYKKYEEMYLREKEHLNKNHKKQKPKIENFGILTASEDEQISPQIGKISNDSAYGSLQRRTSKNRNRGPKLAPLEQNHVDSTSSSGSENCPNSPAVISSDNGKQKLPKFCHECGNKYPLATAKFCIECGVRRLVL